MQNTILCIKWGDKYDDSYVEKLKEQCEDNCSVPFNFYCLTDNPKNDWDRIKNKLPDYKSILDEFDNYIFTSLEKTNILIIKKLCELLNIKTEIVIDYPTELKSSDRLVDLCIKHKATEYFSGVGAKEYLDENKFHTNDIKVIYQDNLIKKHTLEIL